MGYYDENPRKRFLMALFIAAYLLPLTCLFFLTVAAIVEGWLGRLAIVLGFGLPLSALWVAVLKYPLFRKGLPPFAAEKRTTSPLLFLLSQGVLAVTVAIASPALLRYLQGYSGLADGIVFIVGLGGVPAAAFAAAVLLKAWKERHRHAT
jgi:hypothetical protein